MITLLIVAVLLGLIPAAVASNKGYGFLEWWGYGALLFIVALPWALAMKPNVETRQTCPLCRTTIDAQARVCPQCHSDLYAYFAAGGQPVARPVARPVAIQRDRTAEVESYEMSPKQLAAVAVLAVVATGGFLAFFLR